MSEDDKQKPEKSPVPLTTAEKEAARRMDMTEGEYGRHLNDLLRSGRVKQKDRA